MAECRFTKVKESLYRVESTWDDNWQDEGFLDKYTQSNAPGWWFNSMLGPWTKFHDAEKAIRAIISSLDDE